MTLTTSTFIEYFHKTFNTLVNSSDVNQINKWYEFTLQLCNISKELYSTITDNDELDSSLGLAKMPLLAMLSEIQIVCPSAIEKAAKKDKLVSVANELLKKYTDEKRTILRKYFLEKDTDNILFIQNYRK